MLKSDARQILETIISASGLILTLSDCKEALATLYAAQEESYLEVDGEEWRIIDSSVIEQVWSDSLEEQLKDCYDLDLPAFIEIDWQATIDNCKVDGLGHHFSTYDGLEYAAGDNHLFRVN